MPTYASNDDNTRRNPYDPRTGSTGDDAEPTRDDEQSGDAARSGEGTSRRSRKRQHSDDVVDRTGEHDPGAPDQSDGNDPAPKPRRSFDYPVHGRLFA